MNNRFLKQLLTMITSLTKVKSLALMTKTIAVKKGMILSSLIRNRKFLAPIVSHKLRSFLSSTTRQEPEDEDDDDQLDGNDKAMGLFARQYTKQEHGEGYDRCDDEDEKKPDLRQGMFGEDEEGDFEDPGGSVVDIVKNSKAEGEDFNLEDEIDRVADLFIRRFHRQMRMQKQLSLKRVHDMLQRSL